MRDNLAVPKILIIEDEADLRDLMAVLLESYNIRSEVAENGKIGLEKLKNGEFHAVLCDIMMPEMSGLECLTRAQVEGVTAPFVFVTGYDDQDRMLQAIRLGALDFISKPFNNNEIVDVVCRALDVGTRRRHLKNEVDHSAPELAALMRKEERMISLMRVRNNKSRIG